MRRALNRPPEPTGLRRYGITVLSVLGGFTLGLVVGLSGEMLGWW